MPSKSCQHLTCRARTHHPLFSQPYVAESRNLLYILSTEALKILSSVNAIWHLLGKGSVSLFPSTRDLSWPVIACIVCALQLQLTQCYNARWKESGELWGLWGWRVYSCWQYQIMKPFLFTVTCLRKRRVLDKDISSVYYNEHRPSCIYCIQQFSSVPQWRAILLNLLHKGSVRGSCFTLVVQGFCLLGGTFSDV